MDSLVPVPDDIEALKNQIAEHKKEQEKEQLKKELAELQLKAMHELTEFDSGMKKVDTLRILKDKNKKETIADAFIGTFLTLLNPRPVIRNMVGIALVIACVWCLFQFVHVSEFDKYKLYLAYTLELSLAAQVLKSASRGLLIPLTATILGVVAVTSMGKNDLLLFHPRAFYEGVLCVGLLGISLTVFTLD